MDRENGICEIYEVTEAEQAVAAQPPKCLFGDLWLEGEVAVMFGETGVGKSMLAVQIAEGVARGEARGDKACPDGRVESPCEVTATGQPVVFIDLESTAAQFRRRYGRYRFSERLIHVRADRETIVADGVKGVEDLIKRVTNRHKAKVVVIDSLSYLKRRIDSTNEAGDIMLALKRLSREREISILVVGRAKGLVRRRSTRIGDLHTGNAIADLADSIFSIGRAVDDHRQLYLTHLKSHSTDVTFTPSHLPAYRVVRARDGFLGFGFDRYTTERQMLASENVAYNRDWRLIRDIRKLTEKGTDIRTIALDLGLSRSTVHRLRQIALDDSLIDLITPRCSCGQPADVEHRHQPAAQYRSPFEASPAELAALGHPAVPGYIIKLIPEFPGQAVYGRISELLCEEAERHPKGSDESHRFGRADYLIGKARAEARKVWQATRYAPTLLEIVAREDFSKQIDWPSVLADIGITLDHLALASNISRSQPLGTPSPPLRLSEM